MEPDEMKTLKDETTWAWNALGEVRYDAPASEKASLQFRQSNYPCKKIAAGELFSRENLGICGPDFSWAPRQFESIFGKLALDVGDGLPGAGMKE